MAKAMNNNRKGLKGFVRRLIYGPASSSPFVIANGIDYGVTVSQDTALRFTAVFAAIKLLAENIASLPKSVTREIEGKLTDAKGHSSYGIITRRPNDYTDRFTFWFSFFANVLGWGNAYAVIKFGKNFRPESIHRVNPEYVSIDFTKGAKTYIVQDPDPAMSWLNGTYLEHEMIHVMYFTLDGITGIDPISYNAISIGRGLATQKFSSEFYRKGGQIKGVLETDGVMGDEQYKRFMEHYRSASGNFDTPLLEYGIKYKNVGISPVAAQILQSEEMSIQDIARIFNVPPHLLADLTHATFSNIEQQNIFFAGYSLRPLCKRAEEQLELKLFYGSERDEYSVKFDLRGMMRGDDAARAAYYASGINAGWLTPNEARDSEGMQALPGLDSPRMPLNTGYVDDSGNIVNPNNDSNA